MSRGERKRRRQSEATQVEYDRIATRLDESGQTPYEFCEERGLSYRTFWKYRAAMLTRLRNDLAWCEYSDDLDPDVILNKISQIEFEGSEEMPYRAMQRPKTSKRASLRGLAYDWREKFADELVEPYKTAWSIQAVTGCRTQDLVNGVVIEREGFTEIGWSVDSPDIGFTYWIYFPVGSKVTSDSGQKWRRVLVSSAVALPEGEWTLPNRKSYDTAVQAVSDKLYPRRKKENRPSAYSLRHAFASDLKAIYGHREVAMAMGHRATRSQQAYGHSRRASGSKSFELLAVEAATEPRMTHGRAGLDPGEAPGLLDDSDGPSMGM